jgi:hypothetical protein
MARKAIERREAMTGTIRTAVLAGVVAAFGVAPAFAQVDDPMTFTTTFPFTVGQKLMPAGHYRLSPVTDEQGVYKLTSRKGTPSVYFLTNPTDGRAPRHSQVTFDKQGNHYVLKSIREQGESEGEMIPAAD